MLDIDPTIDPQRLRVAVHELGHALVWKAGGYPPTGIRVHGRGDTACGEVTIGRVRVADVDAVRSYFAGLLAGRLADQLWCDQTGQRFRDHTCYSDLASFRVQRRTELGRQVSRAEATAAARTLVRSHWARIVRLAPRLATAGRISV